MICPWGSPVDAATLRAGTFGLVHQFGVGLVDEAALLGALESGHLRGAALDVHAREPADPGSALLRHPRVLATPHVGGLTAAMFSRTAEVFARNLERWAAGQPPRWAVNAPALCRSA